MRTRAGNYNNRWSILWHDQGCFGFVPCTIGWLVKNNRPYMVWQSAHKGLVTALHLKPRDRLWSPCPRKNLSGLIISSHGFCEMYSMWKREENTFLWMYNAALWQFKKMRLTDFTCLGDRLYIPLSVLCCLMTAYKKKLDALMYFEGGSF